MSAYSVYVGGTYFPVPNFLLVIGENLRTPAKTKNIASVTSSA
jgi:hypothetical protein